MAAFLSRLELSLTSILSFVPSQAKWQSQEYFHLARLKFFDCRGVEAKAELAPVHSPWVQTGAFNNSTFSSSFKGSFSNGLWCFIEIFCLRSIKSGICRRYTQYWSSSWVLQLLAEQGLGGCCSAQSYTKINPGLSAQQLCPKEQDKPIGIKPDPGEAR